MAAPVVATIAIQVMLGWLSVISGIAEGIHAFMVKEWRGFLLELLSAVLYLGVGLLLLVDPLKGCAGADPHSGRVPARGGDFQDHHGASGA